MAQKPCDGSPVQDWRSAALAIIVKSFDDDVDSEWVAFDFTPFRVHVGERYAFVIEEVSANISFDGYCYQSGPPDPDAYPEGEVWKNKRRYS